MNEAFVSVAQPELHRAAFVGVVEPYFVGVDTPGDILELKIQTIIINEVLNLLGLIEEKIQLSLK